jgi:hypothetical protein
MKMESLTQVEQALRWLDLAARQPPGAMLELPQSLWGLSDQQWREMSALLNQLWEERSHASLH